MSKRKIYDYISQYPECFSDVSDGLRCVICKNILVNAYGGACGCLYCQSCVHNHFVGNIHCPGKSEECYYTQQNNGEFAVSHFTNKQIENLVVKCCRNKCGLEMKLKDIVDHIGDCKMNTILCLYHKYGCMELVTKMDMDKHMKEAMEYHLKLVLERNGELNNELNDLNDILKNERIDYTSRLSNVNKEKESHVEDLQNEKTQLIAEVNRLKEKTKKNILGEYIWKLTEVDQFIKGLNLLKRNTILSDPFYIYPYGYRMRLKLVFKCSDVQVYFSFCKGDYDASLVWPCDKTIELSLLLHSTMKPYCSYSFNLISFPAFENSFFCTGNWFGETQFTEKEALTGFDQFMRNGIIFIKCTMLNN